MSDRRPSSLLPLPFRFVRAVVLACAFTAVVAGSAVASHSAAAGWTPDAIVAATNAERTRHGIPPLTLNREWAASCARHVDWLNTNTVLEHEEVPGTPGYSEEGDWAGRNAILAAGSPWENGNPWATAPLHLNQMLAPQLRSVGAWEADGTNCFTTWPGMADVSSRIPRFATWPGSGVEAVAPAVTASEWPFVPGEFVGLPEGTETGPNMMVYAAGWDAVRILSASLRASPGAAVEVRTIDRSHPTVGPYLAPGSGFVIPARPLAPGTRYAAQVRVRNLETGATATYRWQFATS
jgi:Cysteine-rich secretory protein family